MLDFIFYGLIGLFIILVVSCVTLLIFIYHHSKGKNVSTIIRTKDENVTRFRYYYNVPTDLVAGDTFRGRKVIKYYEYEGKFFMELDSL